MAFLLHHAIERAAERQPAAEAFRFRASALTYGETARRVGQLAGHLHARGVRRLDRVGIYVPKCLELGVAVHGILRAGAAFVPIDPAAPTERVAFILRDCGIRHLITHPGKARAITELQRSGAGLAGVIGLPSAATAETGVPAISWEELAACDAMPPDLNLCTHDLAYVMYTSGSTGLPKGLMHTHASGLAYASLAVETYGVQPGDRLGNHSPLHFDMSTFEFLAGPLAGATTVIIPDDTRIFPVALARLIETERLTFWYSVPLALIQMLARGEHEQRDWSSLRWVLFGGEPFPPRYLRELMRKCPQARFSNVYGPAEVNQCTFHHLDASTALADDEPVPIGRIWPNTEALIVDANDRSVASGDAGELLVRSATMMHGYWGRPDLDAQAFFETEPVPGLRHRFYRTGDLVRARADGTLVFLGRKDRQIKIRGYRLELDEVEAVVSAHPALAEAAVVAVRDVGESLKIIAFARPQDGATITADELRQHSRDRLPAYGVPAEFVLCAQFPRTGTGKTDRPALQRWYASQTSALAPTPPDSRL